MLGKMLKYDLKAMSKTMLPFFLVIIGMTVLNSFFIHFEWMTGIIAGSSIIFGLFIALGFTGMPQIVIETSLKHNDQVRTAFPECFLYLVVVIQYLVDIEIVTGIQFVDDLPGGYIF